MSEPLSLSTTAISTAMQCLKKFEFRYIDHLVSRPDKVSTALRRGTWLHACLQEIHRGRGWGQMLTRMSDWALEHGVPQEVVDKMAREVVGIINGYLAYWATEERYPLKPVAVEEQLKFTLPSGDELTATLDTISEWGPKGLYVVEHKSTAQFPDADWRAIDPQTALQYLLCRLNKIDVQGIIFNYLLTSEPPIPQVLKNGSGFYARDITTTSAAFEKGAEELRTRRGPGIEEYITEARAKMVNDSKFFRRDVVYRPDGAVAEILRDVKWVQAAIRLAQSQGHWPRSINQMTCPRTRGPGCTYYEVCMVELLNGGKESAELRKDLFAISSPDLMSEGR